MNWYLFGLCTFEAYRPAYFRSRPCLTMPSLDGITIYWSRLRPFRTFSFYRYCSRSCLNMMAGVGVALTLLKKKEKQIFVKAASAKTIYKHSSGTGVPSYVPAQTLGHGILDLKGNITFVCAHTANAAWFFPAIIVVTLNVTQKCQRRISRLFVSRFLCFKYALRDMCYMRILIY